MNLSVRQLRYVAEVARLGSIQEASRSLRISQSSILAAISLAEAEMGASLFNRKRARGAAVTPAGERFVQAARNMIAAEAEFSRSIGDLSDGLPKVLRIGCFEPFGALFMPEMLRHFTDTVGRTEIDLREGDQVRLQEWLLGGEIDLAILYDIGTIAVESLSPICRVPAHALLHVSDPLAMQDGVWLGELATRPLVLLDLPQTSTYLLTLFDVLAKRPEVRFRTRSYETVRSAVASGFGMAILNMRPIGQATADGDMIVRKPILDEPPPPTLLVADIYGQAKPRFVNLFVRSFAGFFRDVGVERFAVTTPDRAQLLSLAPS